MISPCERSYEMGFECKRLKIIKDILIVRINTYYLILYYFLYQFDIWSNEICRYIIKFSKLVWYVMNYDGSIVWIYYYREFLGKWGCHNIMY